MTESIYIAIIFAAFLVKHFLADFPLQFPFMVIGKGKEKDWILPLFAHASIHGILTFLILIVVTKNVLFSLSVSLLEIIVHLSIDRVKASPYLLGRFKDTSKPVFWWCLGLDQLAHGLCYVAIAASI